MDAAGSEADVWQRAALALAAVVAEEVGLVAGGSVEKVGSCRSLRAGYCEAEEDCETVEHGFGVVSI